MADKYPEIIQEVRGTGLMLAVEFRSCELGYETSKGLFARKVMTAGTLVNAIMYHCKEFITDTVL